MRKNIHVPQIKQPFDILDRTLNISNQNIHNLIYSSRFHWDEESITTAFLASIYGEKYFINGKCFECGMPFSTCPNGNTPPLQTSARVASFNRSQESEHSGSDFLLSHQGSKFLFQAKVITNSTPMNIGTWDKIFHNQKKQLITLLTFSLKHNAKPYYLFYVMSNSPHHSSKTKCLIHTSPYDTVSLIIPAYEILRIHRSRSWDKSKHTFNSIISPECIPLTCLFKSCQNNNNNNQSEALKLLDSGYNITPDGIFKHDSDIPKLLYNLLFSTDIPDLFDACREELDEFAILEILKRSGKLDMLDRLAAKEKRLLNLSLMNLW